MQLRLTGNEIEILRSALDQYHRSTRDQARQHCGSYSTVGIQLCQRRAQIEALLDQLNQSARTAA